MSAAPARHLVVFAKAPRYGAVKRRLAAEVGELAAWRFYRTSLARILARLGHDRRWRTWLAVTPDRWAMERGVWPRPWTPIPQGPGDLGARMGRVMRRLPPGAAVIVGSDVPEVTPQAVARAFSLLRGADAVFGPSPDGGYWLVGLRPLARRWPLFRSVAWSSRRALAETIANLPRRASYRLAQRLRDIDDGESLAAWSREGTSQPSPGLSPRAPSRAR